MRVTESMGPAWERMKNLLFRPLNLGTWFSFGLVFFLQSCIEGGGGMPNIPSGSSSRGHGAEGAGGPPLPDLSHVDTSLVLAIVVGVIALTIPLVLLMSWLGTRGQMIAIRAIASGDHDVGQGWSATSEAGGRLFRFYLVLTGIGLGVSLPLLGVAAWRLYPMFRDHAPFEEMAPTVVVLGLVAVAAMLPLGIVRAMARNFVAPIMLKHGIGAREGWRRFWAVGKGHLGGIFLFFVLRSVVGFVAYLLGTIASFVTCCLGFLPVVHQTLMAPYHVFERAWGLEVLASMSPDFDLRGGTFGGPTPGAPGAPAGPPAPPNPYDVPTGGSGGASGTGASAGGDNPYLQGYGPPPAGGFGGPPQA